jgi:RNA polymerase sigma-70 factor (ECF subfamily)
MPPLALWLRGRDEMIGWYLGYGIGCSGSRLVPVDVSGQPGFAQYKPSPDGGHEPWCIQVLELSGGRIAHVHHFLGGELFERLGLPSRL